MPTPAAAHAVVSCQKTYYADRRTIDPYAFLMSVHVTGQSFTVYAARPDAYTIGAEYTLTLTPRTPTDPTPIERADTAR